MKLYRKLDKHQRISIPKDALSQIGYSFDDNSDDRTISIDVRHVDGKKVIILEKENEGPKVLKG